MMTLAKTLLTTAAAVVVLSAGAMAEGYTTNDTNANTSTQGSTMMDGQTSGNTTSNTSVNMDANTVQEVQTSLRNEGYSVSTDGVWGPQTAEALRQFQQANGLSTTGTVNAETLAALEINR
jgi:peptidoglycan hydrolase-like protein with peptidoglycan-binding domain